jgi:putative DNA primase/helicase
MASSLDDVIGQMRANGIDVPLRVDLNAAFAKVIRWKPECEKKPKKSAWARLHEFKSPTTGKVYIVGTYGWRNDRWNVEASNDSWSPADRAAALEARKAAQKAAEAARAEDAEKAAKKASGMWAKGRDGDQTAKHPYLERKKVGAFGVRVAFERLLVPLRNVAGDIVGLQYIDPNGSKIFGTGTAKEGHFHMLGELVADQPIAFAEGYATAATVHMATGWPVVCCFDAGNLEQVVAVWRKLYPDARFVIAADDDRHLLQRVVDRLLEHYKIATSVEELRDLGEWEWSRPDGATVTLKAGWKTDDTGTISIGGTITCTGQPDYILRIENAGRARAMAAAKRNNAVVLLPAFQNAADPGTDWNDLHCQIGLPAVREQILKAFGDGGVPLKTRATKPPQGEAKGKGKAPADPPAQGMDFLERYTLIYGTTTCWDAEKECIVRIEAMKTAYGKAVDWWLGSDNRKMVDQANVVFDPTGEVAQPGTHVNLFTGLQIEPKKGDCDLIVRHLMNLCGEDDRLFHWVACWLALPLQRLGTKLRTSLILHGRQEGTGKSLMMDVMRRIYGRYSRSITQVQLQSEFNGWQSGMLFCVAEEVVSASERKNLKNLLQNMITNPVVQINEKNMPVREESSHANFSFLSNEQLPMLLNETDRRFTVIQVEEKRDLEYFRALGAQINSGGVEAFYQWLLDYRLEGFDEYTLPFETPARTHLITLGMQPDQRFVAYWSKGHTPLPYTTCSATDLYKGFRAWCKMSGERFIANHTQFGLTLSSHLDRIGAPPKKVKRYDAYKPEDVEKNDFGSEVMTVSQQGVVIFIPADQQRVKTDGSGEPAEDTKTEDVTSTPVMNKRIKQFQYALGSMMELARRTL